MNTRIPATSLPSSNWVVFITWRHLIVTHVLIEVIRIYVLLLGMSWVDVLRIMKLMMLLCGRILWISWSVHLPVRCRHVAVPHRHLLHFNEAR